jgi:adenine deaminase
MKIIGLPQVTRMKPLFTFFFYCMVLSPCLFFSSCAMNDHDNRDADVLLYHAYVYPVDGNPVENGAVVIRDGKIILVGASDEIIKDWGKHTREKIDCHGDFLMPGFIEGHGHFNSLGK